MRAACVIGENVGDVRKVSTPKSPKEGIVALAGLLRECAGDEPLEAAAGGFPGVVANGTVHYAPNLPEWKGVMLAAELSHAIGAPVKVHNDGDCAALGEAVYGAGKGFRIVAYAGIGTGVGCGRIVDGRIDGGAYDLEAGHQVVDVREGKELEQLVGGRAFEERFGMHPGKVPREKYDEMTPMLAAGLYNMVLHWSPEVLVLGGSMMNEENGYRLDDVAAALKKFASPYPKLPELKLATHKDSTGLWGAAALVRG